MGAPGAGAGRIVLGAAVLAGKPVGRGTRLAVEFVVGLLAQGWTTEQLLDEYPGLTAEDVRACLQYASDVLRTESVHPLPA